MSQNGRASELSHSRDASADSHVLSGWNLSGYFSIRVLLRSDALADCCIAFLPIDGVDDLPKFSSLISRYVPLIGRSFLMSPRSPVGRFPPGFETLDEWIGRREAGIESLTLSACLLPDSGVLESVVVFFAVCDISHGMLIF